LEEKNYLEGYVEMAMSKPNNDFHLAFGMRGEMNFFNNDAFKEQWAKRIEYFERIDVSQNPFIEAVYYYGKWKIEGKYDYVNRSLAKFLEMEELAYKKGWFWVLTGCIKEQVSLFFKLDRKSDLISIGDRISDYIKSGKETCATHTIMELATQYIRTLEIMSEDKHPEIYDILLGFAQNKNLSYSFREGFFDACIRIKNLSKDGGTVEKLHRDVLNLKIEEAREKGTQSKYVLARLLENALAYCFTYVKDKDITEDLKKEISHIDYSDELKTIELPEEDRKELDKKYKAYDEHIQKTVEKYIEKLKGYHPVQILYNVLNDESIFRMNVEDTKDFTNKLLKESVSSILSTTLNLSFKRKKLENDSEKFDYRLNENLLVYLNDNLWLIYYIISRLQNQKMITVKDIYSFLSNCEIINENDMSIIMWGILRHFDEDYISSVSILTPKIESTLFLYLDKIKADTSVYSTTEISQRSLGGLIELSEVKDNFSIDFQYFLKLLLVADDSINFRNRLSHGSINVLEFNERVSLNMIFIILKIYAKTFKVAK